MKAPFKMQKTRDNLISLFSFEAFDSSGSIPVVVWSPVANEQLLNQMKV